MSVKEIERAVENLPPEELTRFREWFEGWLFDQQIEADAKSGALDVLGDEALKEFHAGERRDLDELLDHFKPK